MTEYKAGDIVILKEGGRLMTVKRMFTVPVDGSVWVECTYKAGKQTLHWGGPIDSVEAV